MSSQRIENRYTVFKDADLDKAGRLGYISEYDLLAIGRIEYAIRQLRRQERRGESQYVVFQSNWEVFKDAKKLLQSYIDRPPYTFNPKYTLVNPARRASFCETPKDDGHTGNPRLSEHG